MKKVFLIMLFAAGVGMISAFAQSTFEKSKMLSKDEVPVTAMQSLHIVTAFLFVVALPPAWFIISTSAVPEVLKGAVGY